MFYTLDLHLDFQPTHYVFHSSLQVVGKVSFVTCWKCKFKAHVEGRALGCL